MKSKGGAWRWLACGLAVLGSVAILFGAGTVRAQPFGGGRMMALGGILNSVDLTTDQKHQIAAILRAHKSELIQAQQKMSDAGRTMMETALDDDAKPEVVQAKLDAAADAGKALGRVWLMVRREVIAVLTPQQKQDLARRRQRFTQRMEARLAERRTDQEHHLDDLIERLSR